MLQVKTFSGAHEFDDQSIERAEEKANKFLRTLMTDDIISVQTQTIVKPKETSGRVNYYIHHYITVIYRV